MSQCYLDNSRNKFYDSGDMLDRCNKCRRATGVINYFGNKKSGICIDNEVIQNLYPAGPIKEYYDETEFFEG
jgi:hypothetical protein